MWAIHECGAMSGSYAYSLPSVVLLAEFTKLIISSLDLQQVPNTPLKNHCHFGAFAKMPIRSIIFTSHVWLPGCVSGLAFLTAEKGSVFQVSLSWIVFLKTWSLFDLLWDAQKVVENLYNYIIHFLASFPLKRNQLQNGSILVFFLFFPMDFSSFLHLRHRQHAMYFGHRWSRGHLVRYICPVEK